MRVYAIRLSESYIDYMARGHSFYSEINIACRYDIWLVAAILHMWSILLLFLHLRLDSARAKSSTKNIVIGYWKQLNLIVNCTDSFYANGY